MRCCYRLTVLAFLLCCVSFTAVQAATNFNLILPAECKPAETTVLCGNYGHGLALSQIATKKDVFAYTVSMPDYTQKLKLLIHQSGYRIVAVEIDKADLSKPFTPTFIPLRSNTLHVRLVDSGGKPILGEQLTIAGGDWNEMTYFGYANGMVFGMKNAGSVVVTDNKGEALVMLPAWVEDPYYMRFLKKIPTFHVVSPMPTGASAKWNYLPAEMQAQHEYPDPLVITKLYRASLTVRFDPAYLARQGLQGLFGKPGGKDHAIVVIQDPDHRTTLTMYYAGGVFTERLQPGIYSLGIEVFNEVDKSKPHIRYIALNKDFVLKEKEQREIVSEK